MSRDKTIRLAALIVLCALVYYFSYEQGRVAQEARVSGLEAELKAGREKQEQMAGQIRQLQARLARCPETPSAEPTPPVSDQGDRVVIRAGASRKLLEGRIVVSCLNIQSQDKAAVLQVNMVREDRLESGLVGLGQSLKFALGGQPYALILGEVHPTMVSLQLVRR